MKRLAQPSLFAILSGIACALLGFSAPSTLPGTLGQTIGVAMGLFGISIALLGIHLLIEEPEARA